MRKTKFRGRLLAGLLSGAMLLTGCGSAENSSETVDTNSRTENSAQVSSQIEEMTASSENDILNDVPEQKIDINDFEYTSLDDRDLSRYMEDAIFSDLESRFHSDDYHIDNVASIYLSKEYIEELEYNSKQNIYFGYSLSELNEQFQGKKYVFTLDENGSTVVKEFEKYDDSYIAGMLKDVAIGTGVLLFCVTVSIVSAGAGAPAVSLIFAASAKTGATMALSGGAISALTEGAITGFQTGDFQKAIQAAEVGAARGYKIGAISGALIGGAQEGIKIFKSGKEVTQAVTKGNSGDIGSASEKYAEEFYKGEEQLSYLGGNEVPHGTPGATRPDIIVKNANSLEAVEVKNYDLVNNLPGLKNELKRQIGQRVTDLPPGSTQRIALVTKGRGYSSKFVDKVVEDLQSYLFDTYGGKIPIDIL